MEEAKPKPIAPAQTSAGDTGRRFRDGLLVLLIALLLALAYTHPALVRLHRWGVKDWDFDQVWHGTARRTILQYHQFPLWNPYEAGGRPLLANPEARILTPFFPLHLIFGTIVGTKLSMVLHLVVGLAGAYCLGRHFGMDRLVAWLPAVVYGLNSKLALHMTEGLGHYLSVVYIPWAVLFFLKSFDRPAYCITSSICVALIFLDGGHYYVIITLTCLGLLGIGLAFVHGAKNGFGRIIVVATLTVCFGAVKFFPAIVNAHQHVRENPNVGLDGLKAGDVLHGLFDRDQSLYSHVDADGRFYWLAEELRNIAKDSDPEKNLVLRRNIHQKVLPVWTDQGMYVGWATALLCLLGLQRHWKQYWWLALVGGICLWLAFGLEVNPTLWSLLEMIPPYNRMIIVPRFVVVTLLIVGVFAGLGLQFVRQQIQNGHIIRMLLTVVAPAIVLVLAWEARAERPFDPVGITRWDVLQLLALVPLAFFATRENRSRDKGQEIAEPSRVAANTLMTVLVLGILVDFLAVSTPIMRDPQAFPIRPQKVPPAREFVQTAPTPGWNLPINSWEEYGLYRLFLANRGAVDAPFSFHYRSLVRPEGDPNYRGELWLYRGEDRIHSTPSDGPAGVSLKKWTPNRIVADARTDRLAVVVVNQCYNTGWKVKVDGQKTQFVPFDGLIAVAIPPGQHTVEFYYLPVSFVIGAIVSLLTIGTLIVLAVRRRRALTATRRK